MVEIIIGKELLPTEITVCKFKPKPKRITAYCKTFLETKLIPVSNLTLFFNINATISPIIIPNTGPPTTGNSLPNFQAGRASTKHKIIPFNLLFI